MSNHPDFDDDMAPLDQKTVQFIQKLDFHRNILNFFFNCIPSFDSKHSAMKNKVDENLSNPRWYLSKIVPFTALITLHEDLLPLGHMAKNNMGSSQEVNSSSVFCWLYKTCSSPRRDVRSHSLVCSKIYFLIMGIGPIRVKEL